MTTLETRIPPRHSDGIPHLELGRLSTTMTTSSKLDYTARAVIAAVWIFHGTYSKILDQILRHRLIVGRILGENVAAHATIVIGVGEILLGLWVLSGRARRSCALVQTLGLIAMNTLEIIYARDLLISAPGMVLLNVFFLTIVWWWAGAKPLARERAGTP
jgi:uncharacterized membrane protein YphA (DoxX/SURF4 family)